MKKFVAGFAGFVVSLVVLSFAVSYGAYMAIRENGNAANAAMPATSADQPAATPVVQQVAAQPQEVLGTDAVVTAVSAETPVIASSTVVPMTAISEDIVSPDVPPAIYAEGEPFKITFTRQFSGKRLFKATFARILEGNWREYLEAESLAQIGFLGEIVPDSNFAMNWGGIMGSAMSEQLAKVYEGSKINFTSKDYTQFRTVKGEKEKVWFNAALSVMGDIYVTEIPGSWGLRTSELECYSDAVNTSSIRYAQDEANFSANDGKQGAPAYWFAVEVYGDGRVLAFVVELDNQREEIVKADAIEVKGVTAQATDGTYVLNVKMLLDSLVESREQFAFTMNQRWPLKPTTQVMTAKK